MQCSFELELTKFSVDLNFVVTTQVRKENEDFLLLTFDHVGHESSFNNQPDASWNVKKSGIKSQENGDPLIIRIVQVPSVRFFSRTWELEIWGHIKTAVHPTETVQDIVIYTVFSLKRELE